MTTTRDLLNPQVTLVTKLQLMWGGRRRRDGEAGRLAPKVEVWEGGRGRPSPPLPGMGGGGGGGKGVGGSRAERLQQQWGRPGGQWGLGQKAQEGRAWPAGRQRGLGVGWEKGLQEQRCVELLAAEQGVSSPWWSRCMGRGVKPFLPEGPSDQEGHGSGTWGWGEGRGSASCFC